MVRQEETVEEMKTKMTTTRVSPDLARLCLDHLADHDPGRSLYLQHDPRLGHLALL